MSKLSYNLPPQPVGGSAILENNLVDSLVPTIDALRNELNPAFGVRQYRVFTVDRAWPSGVVGDDSAGAYSDTIVELLPTPLVATYKIEEQLEPCGLNEAGVVVLRQVSLTYTEDELTGGTLAAGHEWFFALEGGQGQGIAGDQFFRISKRPHPDRTKDIGWKIELARLGPLPS